MSVSTAKIILKPKQIFIALMITTALLVALSILGQAIKYNHISFYMGGPWKDWKETGVDILSQTFFMDWEGNAPTYFNTMLLFVPALLFGMIAAWKRGEKDRFYAHWLGLAVIFLLLSIDETASLHEKLIKPTRGMINYEGYGGFFYFAWVIPGLIAVALFALAYFRFFLHLDTRSKILFASALTLYIGGVIGGEMLSGRLAETIGMKNFKYAAYTSLEESLEFIGASLLIYWLLDYVKRRLPGGITVSME